MLPMKYCDRIYKSVVRVKWNFDDNSVVFGRDEVNGSLEWKLDLFIKRFCRALEDESREWRMLSFLCSIRDVVASSSTLQQ